MTEFKISLTDLDQNTKDATVLLQKILGNVSKLNDEVQIKFEKGEYHFYKDFAHRGVYYTSNTDSHRFPEKSVAVCMDGLKNVTIDGGGSLFVMHGDMMAFAITNCENITLKNFSWDFPCATTFELQTIKKGMFSAEYKIAPSFEYEINKNKLFWHEKSPISGKKYWEHVNQNEMWCVVGHDMNTNKVKRYVPINGPLASVRKIEKIEKGHIRVSYLKPTPSAVKEGMVFELCTSKNRDCAGSFVCESKNVKLENVNIHYMHGFGFLLQMAENVTFESCNFVPREGTQRHTTSFADLIHASGAKGKIKIHNCNFCNAHDDPINIHGTYTRVKKKIDENTIMLEYVHDQQNGFVQYHEGDKVVFYARDTFAPLENEKQFTVKSVVNPLENGNSVKEMVVSFEENLPSEIDKNLGTEKLYVCENVTYTPEVEISGCRFSAIPTRGILCTTRRKVLIENNIFDTMTMASIYLSNDCNSWYESGPIRDMTIRGNTFYIRRPSTKMLGCKAAIFIDPIVKSIKASSNAVHENIIVEGNTFYMEHDNVINAKSTKNLVFRNNIIKKLDGAEKTIKAFEIKNCTDILIDNNTAEDGIDMSN